MTGLDKTGEDNCAFLVIEPDPNVNPELVHTLPSGKEMLVPEPKTRRVDFQTDPSAKLITEPVVKSKTPLLPNVTVLLKVEGAFPEKTDPRFPDLSVTKDWFRHIPGHWELLVTPEGKVE